MMGSSRNCRDFIHRRTVHDIFCSNLLQPLHLSMLNLCQLLHEVLAACVGIHQKTLKFHSDFAR